MSNSMKSKGVISNINKSLGRSSSHLPKSYGRFFLISLLFLTNCNFSDTKKDSIEAHNVIECNIYDMKGKRLWSFPNTYLCLFMDDGSFIAGKADSIVFYDKNFKIQWQKKIPLHHQLNWSLNRENILILTDDYKKVHGITYRIDKLLVLNLKGHIIKEFKFSDHQNKIYELSKYFGNNKFWEVKSNLNRNTKLQRELSHANSFYEIPENSLAAKIPAFSKGNYIVNLNLRSLVIVINKSLNKILWSENHKNIGGDINMHDVQITRSGKIIAYFNRSDKNKYSSLISYDLLLKKMTPLFEEEDRKSFYAPICGGIQILSTGNILYNHGPMAYEIETKHPRKRIWSMKYQHIPVENNQVYQQIKRVNLTSFLNNNKGL